MKIKSKLLIAFLLTALFPVLIVSALTIHNVANQAREAFIETSRLDMQLAENTFVTFFNLVEQNVAAVADYPALKAVKDIGISTYFGSGEKPSETALAKGGEERRIFEYFSSIGNNNPSYGYVYMSDTEGGYIEWPGTDDYADWDPRNRPWFSIGQSANYEVSRRDSYYWEPVDAVFVSVLKGFKDAEGKFGGVVAIDVSLKSLTDMTQKLRFGETGFFMLLEGNGTVLVDGLKSENSFKKVSDLSDPYYQALSSTENGVIEVKIDGVDYMANVYTSPTLGWKLIGFKQNAEIFASASRLIWQTVMTSILVILIFSIVGAWIARRISSPINLVKDGLKTIAQGEGNLTHRLEVVSQDETGELAKWFNQFIESTQTMVRSIKESALTIHDVSDHTSQETAAMTALLQQQLQSVELIVTAITQMSSAANDVARNSVRTAEVSEHGLNMTREGKAVINRSASSVNQLGKSIEASSQVIQELEQETDNINNILTTIQQIAEQTNLLALNAAIEAARAGDQGRGFAVVADEVRSLAKRSHDSTEQINHILNMLVSRIREVTTVMNRSLDESQEATRLSQEALSAFESIEHSVESIRDMTIATASATEEQHLVTEDINKNVVAINESINQVSVQAQDVEGFARQQSELSASLRKLVARFRTD
ncbi:methyl-accepting chemotaxis protein [Nitrincola iocasae]|uniref:Methyl-accepting chemotaxis protein n=1 Tax=Nitrincola iocasae TaxID=2614693 RepID=A0A5J6LG14_9GAMM|nr:methyl-accepting chemotaxis protein [Nitrincola iocasae]QEW07507.1 methyl-accepting chemotaxis protein [Nitrincola iocasae]